MKYWKKVFLSILAVLVWTGCAASAQAAKQQDGKSTAITPQLPIVIEADDMHFNDSTGALLASGHVIITQGTSQIMAERVDGNAKQSEFWIDGRAHLLQPGLDLFGDAARYNTAKQTGSMHTVKGSIDKQLVTADKVEMFPQETIIHKATVTRCPAKDPDYHVSATKVEIWPGEKMVFYNAKFWIKHTLLFTLPKYQKMLTVSAQSEFPTIGYTSHDGISISQHLEYPLGDTVSLFADPAYYGQSGFKPSYGAIHRGKSYSLSVVNGDFIDTNHHWIQKESEFTLQTTPQAIGGGSLKYTVLASSGFWEDDTKRSWHQQYLLYFTHDPIKINPTTTLTAGAGWQTIFESYDHSQQDTLKANLKLEKKWSEKWSSFIRYRHLGSKDTLFAYERPEMTEAFDVYLKYKIDRLNAVGFYQSYDLDKQDIYYRDIIWYRNLHCWDLEITYRLKQHEVNVELVTVKW